MTSKGWLLQVEKRIFLGSTIQENGRVIIFSELLEKHYRALLLSSEYNHHVYTKAPATRLFIP